MSSLGISIGWQTVETVGSVTIGQITDSIVTVVVAAYVLGFFAFMIGGACYLGANSCRSLVNRCTVTPMAGPTPKFTENISAKCRELQTAGTLTRFAYKRDSLLRQIENKLSTKDNSMVLLYGPAGCGKTAIFEELVYRQVTHASEAFAGYEFIKLRHNELYSLQEGIWLKFKSIVYSNGPQAHLDRLFEKIKNGKYILFIDEASGVIKSQFFEKKLEELARGQVKIILATTTENMQVSTGHWDMAIIRRVPKIEIKEFTLKETFEALIEGKQDYEKKYKVHIEDDAILAIVALSSFHEEANHLPRTHYPHKSVCLCGEIFCGLQKETITKERVLEYYVDTYNGNIHQLRKQIDSIIEKDIRADEAVFKQFITRSRGRENVAALPLSLQQAYEKICRDFFGKKSTVLMVGNSIHVQQALVDALPASDQIIRFNLKQLVEAFQTLSSQEQKRQFLAGFYDLVEEARLSEEQSFVFHIQDGNTLLQLLAEETHEEDLPSVAVEPADQVVEAIASNHFLQECSGFAQNMGNQLGIPVPDLSNIPRGKHPVRRNQKEPFDLKNNELVTYLIGLLKENKIHVMAFVDSDAKPSGIRAKAHRIEVTILPQLDRRGAVRFLENSFPNIHERIIWQVLMAAMYFLDEPNGSDRFPVDVAFELLNEISGQIIESEQAGTNVLASAIQAARFRNKGISEDRQNISNVLSYVLRIPMSLLQEHRIQRVERNSPEHLLEVSTLLRQIVKESARVTTIFEASTERRAIFMDHAVLVISQLESYLQSEKFYSLRASGLVNPRFSEDFQKRVIFNHLQELKRQIDHGNEEYSVLLMDVPMNILSAEASELVNRLVLENQMHVIQFRQPDAEGVAREGVDPSPHGESLLTNIPFYLRPVARTAFSYVERGLGHQNQESMSSLEKESLFMQLSDLSLGEIEAYLNKEAALKDGVIVDQDFISTFAQLFMKWMPSHSLEDLEKQFSVFCAQCKENGSNYTVEKAYEFFSQILSKDVEEVKDSLKPKWIAEITQIGRLFGKYIVRPLMWMIDYVSSRVWTE